MQNLENEILFHQVPMQVSQGKVDSVPSPQSLKVEEDIKAKNEAPVALNDPIYRELDSNIRERCPTPEEKSHVLAIQRNNYNPKPRRDGRRLLPKFNKRQTRFVVPPPVPQNKQWCRVEYQKFPQLERRLNRKNVQLEAKIKFEPNKEDFVI